LPEFDDGDGGDGRRDGGQISTPLPKSDASGDLTGFALREFGLGTDVLLVDYTGSAGYDRVTDWHYYAADVDKDDGTEKRRTPVSPRLMDPGQPSRTRERRGGVVRLFRGELVGGTLESR
jgi:hypothetical protein